MINYDLFYGDDDDDDWNNKYNFKPYPNLNGENE